RSYNITDVLIVVVRYFGGTKLGVGGLINAYKTAAADAIENSTIITKITSADIRLQFYYLAMNDVMRLVKDYDLHIKKQEFENTCHMVLEVRMSLQEEVRAKLSTLVDVQVKEPQRILAAIIVKIPRPVGNAPFDDRVLRVGGLLYLRRFKTKSSEFKV